MGVHPTFWLRKFDFWLDQEKLDKKRGNLTQKIRISEEVGTNRIIQNHLGYLNDSLDYSVDEMHGLFNKSNPWIIQQIGSHMWTSGTSPVRRLLKNQETTVFEKIDNAEAGNLRSVPHFWNMRKLIQIETFCMSEEVCAQSGMVSFVVFYNTWGPHQMCEDPVCCNLQHLGSTPNVWGPHVL